MTMTQVWFGVGPMTELQRLWGLQRRACKAHWAVANGSQIRLSPERARPPRSLTLRRKGYGGGGRRGGMSITNAYLQIGRVLGWAGWAVSVAGALYLNAVHPVIDQVLA
eukprot:gene12363-12450_t